jgi:hypothetical protein
MTITVYYTEASNIFINEPELVLKNLPGVFKKELVHCPAFTASLKNTYMVNSPIDYDLSLTEDKIISSKYDQKFFEDWVLVRSVKDRACSFLAPMVAFFSEIPITLELKAANYHPNGFTDNSILVEGSYNIGKTFRFLEAAFLFKDSGKVVIAEGKPLYYVKFCTEEKVKLVPFHYTPEIQSLYKNRFAFRKNQNKPLSYWYNMHDKFYKKRLLKLIKKNLL